MGWSILNGAIVYARSIGLLSLWSKAGDRMGLERTINVNTVKIRSDLSLAIDYFVT